MRPRRYAHVRGETERCAKVPHVRLHCCPRRSPKLELRLFRIVKVEHKAALPYTDGPAGRAQPRLPRGRWAERLTCPLPRSGWSASWPGGHRGDGGDRGGAQQPFLSIEGSAGRSHCRGVLAASSRKLRLLRPESHQSEQVLSSHRQQCKSINAYYYYSYRRRCLLDWRPTPGVRAAGGKQRRQ